MGIYRLTTERASQLNLPTLLTAIGALIGAVTAVVAIFVQGGRTRRQLGIENIWRLIDLNGDIGVLLNRAEAARSLLENGFPELPPRPDPSVVLVLDTYEFLAYLVRIKTLSINDVWTNFPGAIDWWHVTQPLIAKYQEDDPTIYEEYARLAKRLVRMETKKRGSAPLGQRPLTERLHEFLETEANLIPEPPPAERTGLWRRLLGR